MYSTTEFVEEATKRRVRRILESRRTPVHSRRTPVSLRVERHHLYKVKAVHRYFISSSNYLFSLICPVIFVVLISSLSVLFVLCLCPPPIDTAEGHVLALSVRECVRPSVLAFDPIRLLARHLTDQWTEVHRTLVDGVLEAVDELIRFTRS